ncbi:MAG TPA: hypothetical protein VK961_08525 [Chthoniobacter sp.]|nr:hypothetical protein [Chthoniobacter sp.]
MINEVAGHVWWIRTHPDSYDVYLQTSRAVYRCSLPDGEWREVDASPDPRGFIFSEPLEKVIIKCPSGADGCRYVLFTDNTAIRIFNPPDRPGGMVTILSSAATFLNQDDCNRLFEANDEMPETPIVRA